MSQSRRLVPEEGVQWGEFQKKRLLRTTRRPQHPTHLLVSRQGRGPGEGDALAPGATPYFASHTMRTLMVTNLPRTLILRVPPDTVICASERLRSWVMASAVTRE